MTICDSYGKKSLKKPRETYFCWVHRGSWVFRKATCGRENKANYKTRECQITLVREIIK